MQWVQTQGRWWNCFRSTKPALPLFICKYLKCHDGLFHITSASSYLKCRFMCHSVLNLAAKLLLLTSVVCFPHCFCNSQYPLLWVFSLTFPDRLRGSGTAATNMCLVATGAVEAFFEIGIHCWDIAAGAVIVREAGGILLDVDGLYDF